MLLFHMVPVIITDVLLIAPIAQRIEHRPPEPGAQVRVLLGAPILIITLEPRYYYKYLGFLIVKDFRSYCPNKISRI